MVESELGTLLPTLQEVLRAVAEEGDPRRLWETLAQGACTLVGAPVALATALGRPESARGVRRDEPVLEALAGWHVAPHPLPDLATRALVERRTLLDEDARLRDDAGAPLAFALATPIAREGGALGALLVARARRFDVHEQRLLEILAGHGALALAHAQSNAALARRLARVEEQATAARRIGEAQRVDDVVDRALDVATTLLGADRAGMFLVDANEDIEVGFGRRLSRSYLDVVERSYKKSAGGQLARTGVPLYIADIASDPRTRVFHEVARDEGLHSGLLVPLYHQGRFVGAIGLYHDILWTYEPADVTLVRSFADQVTRALVDARLHEQSERRAQHLELVGVLARALASAPAGPERVSAGLAALVAAGVPCAWLFARPASPGGRPERRAHAGSSALEARLPEDAALAALAAGTVVRHSLPGGHALVAAPLSPGADAAGALVLKPPFARAHTPRPGTTVLGRATPSPPPDVDALVTTCAAQLYTAW
jgi:GAF domain-containing protein